jgi:hypothetical protein
MTFGVQYFGHGLFTSLVQIECQLQHTPPEESFENGLKIDGWFCA